MSSGNPSARGSFGANIVVIGGGTGSFVVLSGLRNYVHDLTALVSMADDGGSTGQLRDEYGALPPGDVRQCLVALSHSPKIRDLFNFRFSGGSFAGHSFGNLFLTAIEQMSGDFAKGIKLAEEILSVDGHVMPITLDQVTINLDHGAKKVLRHEREIDGVEFHKLHPKLWLTNECGSRHIKPNAEALTAIRDADLVVIAPGDLYKSIGPALVVPGVGAALAKTKALKIYVANLVNKPGQETDFSVADYCDEIERLAGSPFLDYVIYNVHQPSKKLLEHYAKQGELPVQIDSEKLKNGHYFAKGAELLAGQIWHGGTKSDPIAAQRTLIRHDPDAVARAIMKIYFA
ncbi:MAG: gluconeogenesis factor YvcK family protein [Candidatus Nanoperiomorbaceae bacterium]